VKLLVSGIEAVQKVLSLKGARNVLPAALVIGLRVP
jgi:hypothetical protein